jgi:hypothetical protein
MGQAMGQLVPPHRGDRSLRLRGFGRGFRGSRHGVEVQVDPFERQTLKAGFHLIGARVETTWVPGAFQLQTPMGQGESTRVQPHHGDLRGGGGGGGGGGGNGFQAVAAQAEFDESKL